MKRPLIIIFLVLLIDQASKFWIKTNMYLGEEIPVFGDWFIIHFTENNGMAFGLEFAGEFGKLFLSIFRICAVIGIGYILHKLVKQKAPAGLITSVSLVMAGAIGNIIDSAFYGMIFNESYNQIAEFMPEGGGYAGFLHGRVVDMLYFPIIEGYLPEWLPMWGGDYFIFFRPVFNIADTAITIGILIIILFQGKYLKNDSLSGKKESIQEETGEKEIESSNTQSSIQ